MENIFQNLLENTLWKPIGEYTLVNIGKYLWKSIEKYFLRLVNDAKLHDQLYLGQCIAENGPKGLPYYYYCCTNTDESYNSPACGHLSWIAYTLSPILNNANSVMLTVVKLPVLENECSFY